MAIHKTTKFGQLKLGSEVVTGLDLASLSALSKENTDTVKFITNITEISGQISAVFQKPNYINSNGQLLANKIQKSFMRDEALPVSGTLNELSTLGKKLILWQHVSSYISSFTQNTINNHITLSAKTAGGTDISVLDIDKSDFIKDSFLSSVSLSNDGKTMWFKFQTIDNKAKDISVDVTDFIDVYKVGTGLSIDTTDNTISLSTATTNTLGGIKVGDNLNIDSDGKLSACDTTYTAGKGLVLNGDANEFSISADYALATISDDIEFLSSEISSKVFVEDRITGATADQLSVVKLPISDWLLFVAQKSDVISSELSNVLFLPQSDYIEAYGQVISNLTMPEDTTDPLSATLSVESVAATKEYVDKKAFDALTHVLSGITLSSGMNCEQMFCVLSGIVHTFGGKVVEG